jgi:hypothetical protein
MSPGPEDDGKTREIPRVGTEYARENKRKRSLSHLVDQPSTVSEEAKTPMRYRISSFR